LGDIVLYNIFYEVFTVCTSIVSQDSNGYVTHARNLDFGLLMGWDVANRTWIISELLRPLTITVNFTRGDTLQYITSGFAGFIGVFTGLSF
jgi:acid ceramidase